MRADKFSMSASRAASFIGCGTYDTPYAMWERQVMKIERSVSDFSRDIMQLGTELEPYVRHLLGRVLPADRYVVLTECGLFRLVGFWKRGALLYATPDSFVVDLHTGATGVVELKTSRNTRDRPVRDHLVQVVHQLLATGATIGLLFYVCPSESWSLWRIDRRDPRVKRFIEHCLRPWGDEWFERVRNDDPPPRRNMEKRARCEMVDSLLYPAAQLVDRESFVTPLLLHDYPLCAAGERFAVLR